MKDEEIKKPQTVAEEPSAVSKAKEADTNTDQVEITEEGNDETSENKDAKDQESKAWTGEDRLEAVGLSRREKRRYKREKYKKTVEGMTRNQKISYFLTYNKWPVIFSVTATVLIFLLGVTVYKNSRPVALSYVIVNAADPQAVDTSFKKDYCARFGMERGYQFHEQLNVSLDLDTYHAKFGELANNSDYTSVPMRAYNGYYDVMIMDEKGAEYCAYQDIIHPIKSYLPADILAQVEDRALMLPNYYKDVVPMAIDISDTEFAKSLNLGYDKVYLGFPGTTEENYENAKRLLIYTLGITAE